MFKKVVSISLVFLTVISCIYAGDRAEFINLGFLEDSDTFMYAQYGRNDEGTHLYSDIVFFNLSADVTVEDKSLSVTYPSSRNFGQNSINALLMSLRDYQALYELPVDYIQTGETLFFQLPGQDTRELISFSDYSDGSLYSVSLTMRPTIREPGTNTALAVTVFKTDSEGIQSRYNAGSLIFPIPDVYDFQLKQAIVSPDKTYMVMVFQTKIYDSELDSTNFRYHAVSVPLR